MALTWQYIAGFFDGEGSIGFLGNHGSSIRLAIVQAGNRGLRLLEEMQDIFKSVGIRSTIQTRKRFAHHQIVYVLNVSNRTGALKFIEMTMPYLHIKKVETQDIYRYLKIYPPLRVAHIYRTNFNCPKGHSIEGENVRISKVGSKEYKSCRRCHVDEQMNRYRTKILPTMQHFGVGMRMVTAALVRKYEAEVQNMKEKVAKAFVCDGKVREWL